jgi:superfamily II DNA or RNA helicase
MSIHYFDALAGAGKTRALARRADRLAQRGQKVLFIQPTKHLITKTIEDELLPLDPSYAIRAIHGDTDPNRVIGEIVAHFQATGDGGEVLFITHAAFMRVPYIENKGRWHLIMDEVPQVDVFEELNLPDTHSLITPLLELRPFDAAYGLLLPREDAR